MLDAEKLKELQAKNIICEQEFVEQKHNLFNRIMRHENNPKAKNGIIYILLAWFVGTIGLHNFYAGYYWRGTVQLFLTLVSWLFMFIPLLFVAIWVLLELLFINKSAEGIPFTGNRRGFLLLRGFAGGWLGVAFFSINILVFDTLTIDVLR